MWKTSGLKDVNNAMGWRDAVSLSATHRSATTRRAMPAPRTATFTRNPCMDASFEASRSPTTQTYAVRSMADAVAPGLSSPNDRAGPSMQPLPASKEPTSADKAALSSPSNTLSASDKAAELVGDLSDAVANYVKPFITTRRAVQPTMDAVA
jgi:hypothetical protein